MLRLLSILLLVCATFCALRPAHPTPCEHPTWGFFGHKRINRMAVMTLPPAMMVFFKPNLEFITQHAVDPDMRRYAVAWEAPRHYIDLDEYGDDPTALPRLWPDALARYTTIRGVDANGDTVTVYHPADPRDEVATRAWRRYFGWYVAASFATSDKLLDVDSLRVFSEKNALAVPPLRSAFFSESLSSHGILPWHLQQMHQRLVRAFKARDGRMILKLSAEFGHYIGDAHVPLHTTSNYNGQKTNQYGIHGFWESRIPELFADESYDYFVGKPEMIENTSDFYWNVVLSSHRAVDSVLNIEQRLRRTFPADQQMCPDVRLERQVLTQCRDFAAAYQADMDDMVERRMRASIHAVSSAWYSAWVEAGEPDLSGLSLNVLSEEEKKEQQALKKQFEQGQAIGRPE
jgi:hypothetical protein